MLRGRRRQLKALLLDQHVIAGHRQHLLRRDPAPRQAAPRPHQRLADHPRDRPPAPRDPRACSTAAIEAGGSTLADTQYVDIEGQGGWFQVHHRVYDRAGQRCLTCGKANIVRVVVGGPLHLLLPALPALIATLGRRRLAIRLDAVFLKSLTLKGFKSFADATTLQLEPGVTVVVGPNGSGKSNVVDAIAWVLGAQAPSAVRSQKMDDVIFAGTAKRPALGRAEVTLTIDNSAGLLPIEFTEVTVSRTLFRTGESEYAINGVDVPPARRAGAAQRRRRRPPAARHRQPGPDRRGAQRPPGGPPRRSSRRPPASSSTASARRRPSAASTPPRPACCACRTCCARCAASCARSNARPRPPVATATSSPSCSALQVFLAGREIAVAAPAPHGARRREDHARPGRADAAHRARPARHGRDGRRGGAHGARRHRPRRRDGARRAAPRARPRHRRGARRASSFDGARPRPADGLRRRRQPGGRRRPAARRARRGGGRARRAGPGDRRAGGRGAGVRRAAPGDVGGHRGPRLRTTSAASAAAEVRGELRSMRAGLERAEAELRRQRDPARVAAAARASASTPSASD